MHNQSSQPPFKVRTGKKIVDEQMKSQQTKTQKAHIKESNSSYQGITDSPIQQVTALTTRNPTLTPSLFEMLLTIDRKFTD